MELHLSMKLDFLNRRKGKAPCWWRGIFEDTFALSVLWSTPAEDYSRYPSFSECWNSREPNEAVAIAAVCSLLFWARRKPRSHILLCFFFFFSQEQLGWEPLQAPLQKWGGLWTTGQTAQGGGQDSPWQWAACLCSATLMRQASNPSGKPSDQREKKREITKKMNYNEWFRKIFLSPSWKWLTNSKNTKGINIVNSRTVYELTWLIKQQSIPHCL